MSQNNGTHRRLQSILTIKQLAVSKNWVTRYIGRKVLGSSFVLLNQWADYFKVLDKSVVLLQINASTVGDFELISN